MTGPERQLLGAILMLAALAIAIPAIFAMLR